MPNDNCFFATIIRGAPPIPYSSAWKSRLQTSQNGLDAGMQAVRRPSSLAQPIVWNCPIDNRYRLLETRIRSRRVTRKSGAAGYFSLIVRSRTICASSGNEIAYDSDEGLFHWTTTTTFSLVEKRFKVSAGKSPPHFLPAQLFTCRFPRVGFFFDRDFTLTFSRRETSC